MRRHGWRYLLALALFLSFVPNLAHADGGTDSATYLVVQFDANTNVGEVENDDGVTVERADPGTGLYRLAVPSGEDPSTVLTQLQSTAGVISAEPDQVVQIPEAEQSSKAFYEGWLTAANFTGQESLALINAPAAQQMSTGKGITVAVLDTGVNANHPALVGHLLPGFNELDPTAPPADTASTTDSDSDGELNDALGHGTAVAGIVASVAPSAMILPIQVLDSEGLGSAYTVAEGIRYAVDHGADVINLSLGMTSPSMAVAAALSYAADHGVVVVAAAGNTGQPDPTYPAGDPNVLAVVATDLTDHKAAFSAYGQFSAVAAPGVDIIAPYYSGGYALWSGTSMAAPLVSGEAALIEAVTPSSGASDDDTGPVEKIKHATVSIDALNPGYAHLLGRGRIDLLRAVSPQESSDD
jgi:subtilisin family serine protease